jgi:LysM repeat protein
VQCYACELDATQECPRCGALYCDDHGDALCDRCQDPALALPSYQIYRGSILALLIGSVFAVWLLVLPPAGADRDAPPSPLAGFTPPTPTATVEVTPTPTPVVTSTPAVTATPTATSTPSPTPTATATPEPTFETYVVESGDSLFLIAERFLPAGRDLGEFADEIAEINGISDPTQIFIGQELQIPGS